MTTKAEEDHARANARAWMDSISRFVRAMDPDTWERLEELEDMGPAERDFNDQEELKDLQAMREEFQDENKARELAEESPLSVEVRSGWNTPGEELEAEEFMILLSTGGPALRIMGELDQNKEPRRAWLEYQDWGTPWTEYCGENVSMADLLDYARVFFYGE